jgi:D-lysine oxidase
VTADRDIVVLGAGIVGVSAAMHLQMRGRQVSLVDRREPGEETSYGNTGVIEGGTYVPIAMPTRLGALLRYARNDQPEMHFHWSMLPKVAPWLMQLRANSSEAKLRSNGAAVMALLAHAIDEHKALLKRAGADVYLRETGWMRIFRTEADFRKDELERRVADEHGFKYTILSTGEARELEPHLNPVFAKAELWNDVASLSDPGAVTKAYAAAFAAEGGRFERAAARGLSPAGGGWRIDTDTGPITAREVVVALGPWSMDLLGPLGYRLPFAVKRGYHMHYRPKGNATLSRPLVDITYGYAMSPMTRGIRVTTGIEFADRDAPASPVQLTRVEPLARELFPIDEAVEDEPWMGRRPSFPDSIPVVGPAPRHTGLWLDFGHAHLGLTLGPVSGRLIAEMICGQATVVEPQAYSVERFG